MSPVQRPNANSCFIITSFNHSFKISPHWNIFTNIYTAYVFSKYFLGAFSDACRLLICRRKYKYSEIDSLLMFFRSFLLDFALLNVLEFFEEGVQNPNHIYKHYARYASLKWDRVNLSFYRNHPNRIILLDFIFVG